MAQHDIHCTRREAVTGGVALVAGLMAQGGVRAAGEETAPEQLRPAPLVTRDELELWTIDLFTGLSGGIPLLKSLEICGAHTKNEHLRQATQGIVAIILRGYPLSDALEINRLIFNRDYVAIVRYGELFGVVDDALEKLLAEWKTFADRWRI
jgi:type II secretory pathway component PulF